MGRVKIAPSILAADLGYIAAACQAVDEAADLLHIDVMDGNFVPALTIGPSVVEAVRRVTKLCLDVHLMMEAPGRYLSAFRRAGADMLSVHWEACPHIEWEVSAIHDLGALAGVALNPGTSVEVLLDVLDEIDYVVILCVNPGFTAQHFWPHALEKIRRLVALRGEKERPLVEVDGGISKEVAAAVKSAGGEILVAGSAVFGQKDPVAAIQNLRDA
jgi:ribulose-phosphate 3-epimerase